MHEVRWGVNYRPGADGSKSNGLLSTPTAPEVDGWALHSQTTFAGQYALPFHAAYHGINSLDSNAGRETWDATLYIGRQLWQGAEVWINPEIDQGFGLAETHGVAGFTNGNAYKVGATDPSAPAAGVHPADHRSRRRDRKGRVRPNPTFPTGRKKRAISMQA
jgi:high affinity Mn2+ porin